MAIVLPPVTELKRVALDLLFPRWCIGCGREGDYLCGKCRSSLKTIAPPVCRRCGRPRVEDLTSDSCPNCAGWENELDGVRAPFIFAGIVREAIHEFKYNNLRDLAPTLAGLMHLYLKDNPVPGDTLVPVPLHRKRLLERGYNQSALLARELGKQCGLPVVKDCLIRTRYTSSQARSAGVSERQHNVTGAFICRDRRLQGKKVILIDDVSTSGATLGTCAGALKAAGAEAVWALVIALEL
jgi:competence protein ComFC